MIIDLQRRMTQVGRIRLGERVSPGGRPTRLERWKLTSRDRTRLEAAAAVFGGKVEPWEGHDGEFALHTETDNLPILLLPNQTLTSWYELWSGGGCQRRCDGETEQLSDSPCLCDPENRECKPHTRLSVMLPDVAGLGVWRLDSTGWYAAVELAGTVDLLEFATAKGVFLPARLRIDQRTVLRNGQTRKFPVPTLDIDVRPLEMHAITRQAAAGEIAAAPQTADNGQTLGHTPIRSLSSGVSLAEGLAAADKQTERVVTARSVAPIGDSAITGSADDFGGVDVPLPVDEGMQDAPGTGGIASDVASSDQQKLLMATAREAGITDAKRYDLTEQVCGEGIRSVKRVPKDKVDELLAVFASPATLTMDELVGKLRDYGNALGIIDKVEAGIATQDLADPRARVWAEHQLARMKQRYEEENAEQPRLEDPPPTEGMESS